jgi:hypothetical protein
MCAQEKKFLLNIPLKVILTDEGTSHFMSNNKKLMRIKLADNREKFGISLNNFSPISVQTMILLDYVKNIEICMPEFVSKRQEVMDLSKVVVYSLMYKQFNHELFSRLVNCECVRKYNRSNPTQILDEQTQISEKELQRLMPNRASVIKKAKKLILDPVWKEIMANKNYSPEERNLYLLMTEKFLDRMSSISWFIVTRFAKDEGFPQIERELRTKLMEYMEKSQLAEYISLMVMELALSNENANLRKKAASMLNGVVENYDELLRDPKERIRIINQLVKDNELVYISWQIGGNSTASVGNRGKLEITLYNKAGEFEEVKASVESAIVAGSKRKTLVDFYSDDADQNLGLSYLSYVDEACKKVGVRFESMVNQFSNDLTATKLNFDF